MRYVIWTITGIIIFSTIFIILRPRIIVYDTLNHPLLVEFKRCKNLGYTYEFYDPEAFNLSWWLNPKLKGINFSFLDTTYQSKIKYYYKLYITLQNNKVKDVSFGDLHNKISPELTAAQIIQKIEKNPALVELFKLADIKECHIKPLVLKYTNSKGEIFCSYDGDIVYFKIIDNIPTHLRTLSPYEAFITTISDKGFTPSDFDSIVFGSKKFWPADFGPIVFWRFQGFISQCGKDIIEVSGQTDQQGSLKWLTNPDTINPVFLQSKIYKKLLETGLSQKYVNQRFKLLETSATRDADYYKKEDKVIESSKISGYFTYIWTTDTWIDKFCGGLQIKISFIYYLNRKNLESVRIGTSTGPLHEQINLHPAGKIIPFEKVKSIVSGIDTNKMNYEIDEDGKIQLTIIKEEIIGENAYIYKYYKIDLESGVIEKVPHGGERPIIPMRRIKK